MLKKKILLLPTLTFMALVSAEAMADTTTTNTTSMPWGRVQATGTGVTNNFGSVGGDAMIPVYGNSEGFAYGDMMGDYGSDQTYLVSPGGGFRKVYNNQIMGAYFFGDYEKTSLGQNFWNLSPGIEWMNPTWDAHLNGYFPTSTSEQSGSTTFASTLGDSSNVTFENGTHNQYDQLIVPSAVIGNGVDAEIGYSFDAGNNALRSRVYVGGYYYQPPTDPDVENITGVTAGFTQAISKFAELSIFNSYDQVSNYNVGVSLTVNLGGGTNTYSNDVHTRLLDPVQRHVGIIDTGAGTYDQQSLEEQGQGLQYTNVYFVSPDGTGNGTYGSSMALDQTSLNTVNTESPNSSRIYVQSGAGDYNVNSTTATSTSGLTVYNGQDFYGRSTDYTTAGQAQINVDGANGYNGFIMNGGENTFDSLNITSTTSGNNTGIVATDTTGDLNLTINNTNISQFTTGTSATNNGTGTLTVNTDNSTFNNNTSSTGNAIGMKVLNANTGNLVVNATDSQFNNNSTTSSSTSMATGLFATNSNAGSLTITATDSQFNGNTATNVNENYAYGMNITNNSTGNATLNAVSSQFNDNTASSNTNDIAAGLYAQNSSSATLTVNATDSTFNGNSSSTAFGAEFVNLGSGDLTANATNSEFNGNNSDDVGTAGLYAANMGSGTLGVTAVNSQFNGNVGTTGGATGYGVKMVNNSTGTTTFSGVGSQFNNNTTYGLELSNASASGIASVTNLTESSFSGNGSSDINGSAVVNNGNTSINYSNTVGTPTVTTDGNVTLTP